MDNVVVRFAPSPTGYLHIGGARTAIFNWLYARKHGGTFMLRIEDTDAERSNEATVQGILESLLWLGLKWDRGPDFQSRHTDDHLAAVRELVESGHAYKCFCSKEVLDEKRASAQKEKRTYQYDGTCRRLSAEEIKAKETAGIPFVIRYKVPSQDGTVSFSDRVYGRIDKRYSDIEDFVLVRTNGQPLYVLANSVDDIRDGITHVIRGQDGLANTPKQILIYKGLGAPIPEFAHMSLTLDPQKAKISKRKHGSHVSIEYYRENGFLPWAMVNFLVLLGWATPDSKELFSESELIDAFSLEGIGRTNSVFNIQPNDPKFFTDPKLININSHYLRTMPLDALLPFVKEQLLKAHLWYTDFESERREWFLDTIDLIRGRFRLLTDVVTYGRPYFSDQYEMDPKAVAKHLKGDAAVGDWMPLLIEELTELDPYDAQGVERMLRDFLAKQQLKPGKLINAVRTAVTGQAVGPEFIDVLLCLGKARVVERIEKAHLLIAG